MKESTLAIAQQLFNERGYFTALSYLLSHECDLKLSIKAADQMRLNIVNKTKKEENEKEFSTP